MGAFGVLEIGTYVLVMDQQAKGPRVCLKISQIASLASLIV